MANIKFANNLIARPPQLFALASEAYIESTQDNEISSFINLGGGNNNLFMFEYGKALGVNGQGGDDRIVLNQGNFNDTVHGGSGNDNIETGAGDDILRGGSGNDTLFGSAGADFLSGGSGNDLLNGDNGAVHMSQHGRDTLDGGSGDDILRGSAYGDQLTGGLGADVFVYDSVLDSLVGEADTITDFLRGTDRIDLSAIDADGLSSNGNSAFVFVDGPSTERGTLWVDGGSVFLNLRGGAPDMQINVNTTLTRSDFVL